MVPISTNSWGNRNIIHLFCYLLLPWQIQLPHSSKIEKKRNLQIHCSFVKSKWKQKLKRELGFWSSWLSLKERKYQRVQILQWVKIGSTSQGMFVVWWKTCLWKLSKQYQKLRVCLQCRVQAATIQTIQPFSKSKLQLLGIRCSWLQLFAWHLLASFKMRTNPVYWHSAVSPAWVTSVTESMAIK